MSAWQTVLVLLACFGGVYVFITLARTEMQLRDDAMVEREKEAKRFRAEIREEITVMQRKLDRALERLGL